MPNAKKKKIMYMKKWAWEKLKRQVAMRYNSASDWLKGKMLGSKTNTAHSRENHRIPGLFSTMNSIQQIFVYYW